MKVAQIAVFTALSLGTNYALIDIPNVKLMDSFVFIAAFLFGVGVGVGSAVSIWLFYGFVNPNGQDTLLLLTFLIVGECFYAIAGAGLRRVSMVRDLFADGNTHPNASILFGLVGLIATFAYDVLTNFASYLLLTSSLYQAFLVGMITGAPFAILHEASNVVFFASVVPIAIAAFRRTGISVKN